LITKARNYWQELSCKKYKKQDSAWFAISGSKNLEMKSPSTQQSAAFAAIFLAVFASGLEFKECRYFLCQIT